MLPVQTFVHCKKSDVRRSRSHAVPDTPLQGTCTSMRSVQHQEAVNVRNPQLATPPPGPPSRLHLISRNPKADYGHLPTLGYGCHRTLKAAAHPINAL